MKSVSRYEKICPTVRFHPLIAKKKRRICCSIINANLFFLPYFPIRYDSFDDPCNLLCTADATPPDTSICWISCRTSILFHSTESESDLLFI